MEDGCLEEDEDLPALMCVPFFDDSHPMSCDSERRRVKRDENDDAAIEAGEDETTITITEETPIIEDAPPPPPPPVDEEVPTEAPVQEKKTRKPKEGDSVRGLKPKPRTNLIPLTPEKSEAEDQDIKIQGRSMDDEEPHEMAEPTTSNRAPQGRVFLSAVQTLGNSTPPLTPLFNTSKFDENHNLTVTLTHPEVNSELWNYMTIKAQDFLEIRTPKKDTLDSPAFVFLDICKQIFQTVCPTHYVRPEHFDIAVGAFISLQRNRLKFVDTFVDFGTKERIEATLKECMANKTDPYPFLERTPNGKPCPGQELIVRS